MEYKDDPIMSVKLRMPQPRKNYIIRHQLFEQLEKITEYKVTIVKAGAGSGKTTLLTSYIKQKSIPDTKWISLDENVNQVFIFWKYVMEVIKEYMGDSKKDVQDFYDGNIQKENLWQILSLFLQKLNGEKDIIIIFDDFQTISDPFLISTMDYFIENMPENIHLVLLTREMPEIYLGSLAMEGSILVIEEDSVRFNKLESLDFLLNTMSLKEEKDFLNNMIEASEGWIGGLQLLAVSLQDRSHQRISQLKISTRMIDDYITREIFVFLSKEEQNFLIKTASLRYFSEEICRQYLPDVNFIEMMESILKKNLFVISIDERAEIYRYHAILSEYLSKLFHDMNEDEQIQLHNSAADIYYNVGDYEESLYHLFEIKKYAKIMDQILQMPQTALTYAYMMKVPMEEIARNADFAYQYFFCYYASVDTNACEKIYDFIKKNMNRNKSFEAFKHTNMFFADAWEFHKVNVLSKEQINELHLNQVTTAFLLIKEAYFLYATSEYREALEYLKLAEEVYKKTGNIFIRYFVLTERTQIYEDLGEFNLCLTLYKEMEVIISQLTTAAPSYYIGIAGVYTRQLELEKAYVALEKTRVCIPKDSLNMERAYQYTLAEYSYVKGDYETTEKILTDIMGQEISHSVFYTARLLRYPIYRGKNMDLARRFAKDYEASDFNIKMLDCDLLYASILYETQQIDKALKLIDSIISKARKTQNKLKIIEGDLIKARILSEQNGNKREIQNLFYESISYAVYDNIAQPFWFEREITEKLLKETELELRKKLSKEEWYFITNINKKEKSKNKAIEIKNDIYDLTEREREVLRELARGSTNKQIAEELCISLATVKSHIINLYGKLGVNNRVAAVNKGEMYFR
jgi:LuxR family maltose regulon positive regulatory protein